MNDPRLAILSKLKETLDPIGLDVFSVVPSNSAKPFIYIGEIETQQVENKQYFQLTGSFNVELYTGSNAYTGSLVQPLTWLNEIKQRVQPTRAAVLDVEPNFTMQTLVMFNDTGLNQFSTDEKLFNAIVQYEFMMTNYNNAAVYNLVHDGVNVIYDNYNVIYINKG